MISIHKGKVNRMRSEQAFKNMVANLFLQVIVFASGIILPRFFLEAYGSNINGMITSVNQFLAYLGLAEAGVGTASVVALYTPLANNNTSEVNGVLSAARRFYNRSGMLFLGSVGVLTVVYPFMISGQLDNMLVRSMILVLASSTLVDYFFLGKYRVLLTANQEGYVVALIQSAGTLVNMILSIALIYQGANVLWVKAVATGVYMLRLFLVRRYAKKRYPELDFHAEPCVSALNQRGAALLHQVVGIIVNNTDVVLLTVLLGRGSLLEVSVYGVYNLIVYAVNMLLTSFSNGLTAGFGEVISKGEIATLEKSYSTYEYMYMIVLFIVTVCMGVLILPFVSVYTTNMTDADYMRPIIAGLFTVIVLLQNIRIPGLTIICAAGHYKETQYQAMLEAVINVVVSLLCIRKFGMAGVLFGTLCSYVYRSIQVMIYNHRKLVKNSGDKSLSRVLRNLIIGVFLVFVGIYFVPQQMNSFTIWFLYALAVGIVSTVIIVAVNIGFEPKEFKELIRRVMGIIRR